jgi:hypothetical protein
LLQHCNPEAEIHQFQSFYIEPMIKQSKSTNPSKILLIMKLKNPRSRTPNQVKFWTNVDFHVKLRSTYEMGLRKFSILNHAFL